jgi:hypothetical protein
MYLTRGLNPREYSTWKLTLCLRYCVITFLLKFQQIKYCTVAEYELYKLMLCVTNLIRKRGKIIFTHQQKVRLSLLQFDCDKKETSVQCLEARQGNPSASLWVRSKL